MGFIRLTPWWFREFFRLWGFAIPRCPVSCNRQARLLKFVNLNNAVDFGALTCSSWGTVANDSWATGFDRTLGASRSMRPAPSHHRLHKLMLSNLHLSKAGLLQPVVDGCGLSPGMQEQVRSQGPSHACPAICCPRSHFCTLRMACGVLGRQ